MMIAMKNYFSLFLLLVGFLASPSLIFSQQESEPPKSSVDEIHFPYFGETVEHELERETDSFPAKFMRMLFILVLLIGFMILASWALKRMMKTRLTQLNTTSSIKIVETRALSPRATLYLLEIQGQTLLVAESPTTVSVLPFSPLQEEELEHESFRQ